MHVSFVYRTRLPSITAASIQFVNTLRALCDRGISAAVWVPGLDADPETCLAYYGLAPHPLLRLEPLRGFYNERGLPRRLQALRESVPDGEAHFLITRAESGLRVFDALRGQARRPGERRIFEQHRLCWAFAAESRDPARPAEESWRDFPEVVEIRRREAAAVADADALVCNTGNTLRALRELGGTAHPALVLPGGTHVAQGAPLPDAKRDIDLLYVGKLKARKGVPDLLGAVARLRDVRAVVAGGRPEELAEARVWAERLGVAHRVEWLGYVAPADLPPLLARSRVGVCPLPAGSGSIADRFTNPLKLLTMLGHHVPIVATAVEPVRAVVEDGRTALLVPPNDPAALAAGIRRLLDDRGLALRLAGEGRRRAEAFTWAQRARRLHDFLATLP